MKKIIALGILFIILIFLFNINTPKKTATVEIIEKQQQTIIKKEEITPVVTKTINKEQLTNNINNILRSYFSFDELERISLSLEIPKYTYKYDYNESLELLSASTIKVPLNMYIYDLAQKNPEILKELITYDEYYYEDGAGIMQDTANGTLFSVQELLENSIIYSDNIATNMLLNRFIGADYHKLEPYFGNANYENFTSTSQNKMFCLENLYNNFDDYETLLYDMNATIFNERIAYYLDDAKVAHKTGDIDSIVHDFGIVFNNKNDYLISISFDTIENSNEKMAHLSEDIYNLIQKY